MNSTKWALASVAALLVLGSACSSRHGLADNSDCDYIIQAETGESVPDFTLQCVNSDLAIDFEVTVAFIGGEGGAGTLPPASNVAQFLLEHYDVTYRNLSTGGSVAGVDVPRPFRRSIAALFDLREEETLEMTGFPVLVSGAKFEAPLNQDTYYPGPSGVVLEATITFWGHPVTDDNAWCFATLRYVINVAPC